MRSKEELEAEYASLMGVLRHPRATVIMKEYAAGALKSLAWMVEQPEVEAPHQEVVFEDLTTKDYEQDNWYDY